MTTLFPGIDVANDFLLSARPGSAQIPFRALRHRDVGPGFEARSGHLLPPQRRQRGGHVHRGLRERPVDRLLCKV